MSYYVTIRTTHEVNDVCLAHLLWDAVHDIEPDDDTRALDLIRYRLPAKEVHSLVRRQLERYGSRSVEVGPNHDYPDDGVQNAVLCRIHNVYPGRR